MIIGIDRNISEWALSGLPIKYKIYSDKIEQIVVELSFYEENAVLLESIKLSYHTFQSGNEFITNIDISDFVQRQFDLIRHKASFDEKAIISPLENFVLICQVKIENYQHAFMSIDGGLPPQIYAILKIAGKDLFSYRLLNSDNQFLLTTRTNGRDVILRETELFPFAFIHPKLPIYFATRSNRTIIQPPADSDGFHVMNIKALREMFCLLYNELPSYIAVYVGGDYVFSISITDSLISPEKFILKFRNSLGWFEMIEVTGSGNFISEISETETYMRFDESTDSYKKQRNNVSFEHSIEVESGIKNEAELYFLQDMLRSKEIYFIDGDNVRECIATTEKLKIPRYITNPQSVPLTIEFVEASQYYSSDLDFSQSDISPFDNITRPGRPQLNALGKIYGDETSLYSE